MTRGSLSANVQCPTGKQPYARRQDLLGVASSYARWLNREGRFVETLYGYQCPLCHRWHLTRHAENRGTPNELVHRAAPRELQLWAMPDGPVEGSDEEQPSG